MIFAVPLAGLRVLKRWRPKRRIVIRYQVPGRKRARLDIAGAWLKDFAEIDDILARTGS